MSSMGEAVLAYSNKRLFEGKQKDVFSNIFNPDNSEFVRTYFKSLRQVSKIVLGDLDWVYYSYFFGDKKNYNNNYLLMLIWEREIFQNLFVKENYRSLNNSSSECLFYLKSNISNYSYGSEKIDKIAGYLLTKNSGMTEKISGNIVLDGRDHIFVCLNTSYIKDWTIVAVYPENHINADCLVYDYL